MSGRRSVSNRSLRRAFRTRPSKTTAMIYMQTLGEDVELFSDDLAVLPAPVLDDEIILSKCTVKADRQRAQKRRERELENLVVSAIEEEEEERTGNDENLPPDTSFDRKARELNRQFESDEDFSFRIENEDGVRMKAVGNKLINHPNPPGGLTSLSELHDIPELEKQPLALPASPTFSDEFSPVRIVAPPTVAPPTRMPVFTPAKRDLRKSIMFGLGMTRKRLCTQKKLAPFKERLPETPPPQAPPQPLSLEEMVALIEQRHKKTNVLNFSEEEEKEEEEQSHRDSIGDMSEIISSTSRLSLAPLSESVLAGVGRAMLTSTPRGDASFAPPLLASTPVGAATSRRSVRQSVADEASTVESTTRRSSRLSARAASEEKEQTEEEKEQQKIGLTIMEEEEEAESEQTQQTQNDRVALTIMEEEEKDVSKEVEKTQSTCVSGDATLDDPSMRERSRRSSRLEQRAEKEKSARLSTASGRRSSTATAIPDDTMRTACEMSQREETGASDKEESQYDQCTKDATREATNASLSLPPLSIDDTHPLPPLAASVDGSLALPPLRVDDSLPLPPLAVTVDGTLDMGGTMVATMAEEMATLDMGGGQGHTLCGTVLNATDAATLLDASLASLASCAPNQSRLSQLNGTQMTARRNVSLMQNDSLAMGGVPFYLEGMDGESAAAIDQLLHVMGQKEIGGWRDVLPKDAFNKPYKLGEGAYGEVFKTSIDGRPVALKIIPFVSEPSDTAPTVNGEILKSAAEVLPEVLISRELSALEDYNGCSTPNFVKLVQAYIVRGRYPKEFLKSWDEFDKRKKQGSENERPSDYDSDSQLFVCIGLGLGGVDVEGWRPGCEAEAVSLLIQLGLSLSLAEDQLAFEHRDLHIGNALVGEAPPVIRYKFRGQEVGLRSHGVLATVIDFTNSRLTKSGTTIYLNLEQDEELFKGQGDYQFDIYRLMREQNKGDWLAFNAKSNALWLHYMSKELLEKKTHKTRIPAKRKKHLLSLFDEVLSFDRISDFLFSDVFYSEVMEEYLVSLQEEE